VEIYAGKKQNIFAHLDLSRIKAVPGFAIVSGFWTCEITATKLFGRHAYVVDSNWKLSSAFLGARRVQPGFAAGVAANRHIQQLVASITNDVGLNASEFFGGTTDGGAHLDQLLCPDLQLEWKWCIPLLAAAATKMAFGIVKTPSQ
jgi:hypothetical protein